VRVATAFYSKSVSSQDIDSSDEGS
jgi:hypothetical protein